MAWTDRDYARNWSTGRGPIGGLRLWTITTWLIALNVGVLVIDSILAAGAGRYPLAGAMYFSQFAAIERAQVWRFLTYQFAHVDLWHLVLNMLSLYFFGPLVEEYLGRGRYLAFYLLCGVAGALLYLALSVTGILVSSPFTPLVGASGAIFGVLMGGAYVAPNARVMLLFPPVPLQLKHLAYGLVGLGALVVLRSGENAGGQAAHLGGAILGFVLIRKTGWLRYLTAAYWRRPRMRYRP